MSTRSDWREGSSSAKEEIKDDDTMSRPGKRVIWVGYGSGRSSGRVTLGSVMVGSVMVGSGSGSVRVSGQIRVNHVRVGFGFGSVGVWVGYISGYLRYPDSDRI